MQRTTAWAGGLASHVRFPDAVSNGVIPVTDGSGATIGWELAASVVMAGRAHVARQFHEHWIVPSAVTVLGPARTVRAAADWATERCAPSLRFLTVSGASQPVAVDSEDVLDDLDDLDEVVSEDRDTAAAGCVIVGGDSTSITWLSNGTWDDFEVDSGELQVRTASTNVIVHSYTLDGLYAPDGTPVHLPRETVRGLAGLAPGNPNWTTRPVTAAQLASGVLGKLRAPAERTADGTVWIADQ